MRNTRIFLIPVVAALMLANSPVRAAELKLQTGSKLWLEGSSTIHEFSSQASKLEAKFAVDPARWPAERKGGEAVEAVIRAAGVTGMDVVVAVTGLHSGKDGLDKNMYKALKSGQQPEIRFHMGGYQTAEGSTPGEMKIEARGTLSIAGVEREVPMTATAIREGDGVRLRGSVPLLMTQFGIKPPSMMMGTIKTADRVVVSFDLRIGAVESGAMSRLE